MLPDGLRQSNDDDMVFSSGSGAARRRSGRHDA
jgi:hypothetical protein